MAKQGSHVPKFGNWDDDNIPYTTYFENARRDKSNVKMNPNDPEDNPKAFTSPRVATENGYTRPQTVKPHPTNSSNASSSQKQRNNEYLNNLHLKTRQTSSISNGSNRGTSLSEHSRSRNRSLKSNETHHRTASIPKFGAWDEGDPNSADGFTLIFNKVKEKKQTAASDLPNAHHHHPSRYATNSRVDSRYATNSRVDGARSSSSRSKICCCFFS